MSDFRNDPVWRQLREEWTADRRADETPTDALLRRLTAIRDMHRVESTVLLRGGAA